MTVTIVIPAYNEEKTIGATLDALLRQDFPDPFAVIVVDNNSTDKTGAVVAEYSNRLPIRLLHETMKGRGAARRCGFAAADSDIVISLDADAIPPSRWLSTFMRQLKNPKIVAVTGTCKVNDLGTLKNILFNIIQPASAIGYFFLFRHFWLSGFSFAVRREIYQASGGFDAALNALEDTDLGFRVMKLGKIKFNPSVPVLVSGRRFQPHFWRGLWEYVRIFKIYRSAGDIYLSDER